MKKPLISGQKTKVLFKKHGLPLYVYRKSVIEAQYKALTRAISYPNTRIFYASKANTNIEVLKILKKLGASVECVSRGEVEQALKAGFALKDISFTCSNILREELLWLMRKGVCVHIDSLTQLKWWGEANPGSEVSVRVNRGFGAGSHSHIITGGPASKFGIYYTELNKARTIAKKYRLTIVGLEQHIGSNILSPDIFVKAMKLILDTARDFKDLEFIDVGGGLGIPYRPEQEPLDAAELGKKLSAVFSDFCTKYGRKLELRLEPGRFLVAEAGALVTRVVDIKHTPGNTFVGLHSGMNQLIRPSLYGSYHHMFNLSRPNAKGKKVHIVGNICESGDVFAKDRILPSPHIGDIILIADTGAYGYTMSSDYNLREKPQEVVIP